ncbi:hypothetical protein ACTXT7_016811 [Hymenolepis weldensis]
MCEKVGNLKPFKCELCEKLFGRTSTLNKHVKSVHQKCRSLAKMRISGVRHVLDKRSGIREQRKLKNFKCEVCEKSFCESTRLRMHVKTVHEAVIVMRERPYSCNYCDKKFIWKISLASHVAKLHEDGIGWGSQRDVKPVPDMLDAEMMSETE